LIFRVSTGYPWVKYFTHTRPDVFRVSNPIRPTGEFLYPYPYPVGTKPVGIYTHGSKCHPLYKVIHTSTKKSYVTSGHARMRGLPRTEWRRAACSEPTNNVWLPGQNKPGPYYTLFGSHFFSFSRQISKF
jgi:hypothetical protein